MATSDFEIIQRIELPDSPVVVTNHRLTIYKDAQGRIYLPKASELKGPIFATTLGVDWLAQVGWPLQLLDNRNMDV